MKIIQIAIFCIAYVLLFFGCYVIWDFYQGIHAPGFNPNDGQAGFAFIGIYVGMIFNLFASILLLLVNLFIGQKKDKIYKNLYYSTNILLVAAGLLLIIAKRFL